MGKMRLWLLEKSYFKSSGSREEQNERERESGGRKKK